MANSNESSAALLETPLHPITQRVVSLHTKFCAPTPVTLRLEPKPGTWVHTGYTVYNLSSGQDVLRIDSSTFSTSDRRVLVDAASNEILAHLRHAHFTLERRLRVCCDRDGSRELFAIKHKSKEAQVQLPNMADNSNLVNVKLEGDWRAAIVCIDQGDSQRLSVARICRPDDLHHLYYLDVAPNMDQVVVVLLCLVLDLRKRAVDYRKYAETVHVSRDSGPREEGTTSHGNDRQLVGDTDELEIL